MCTTVIVRKCQLIFEMFMGTFVLTLSVLLCGTDVLVVRKPQCASQL